jgi:3-phenylpropionate/cinnamic acid dioxygenase small subunit
MQVLEKEATIKRDEALFVAVRNFLFDEAEALDDRRYKDWLANFIDPQIHYVIPIRQTRMEEDGPGFVRDTALQDDDFPALRMRVNRQSSVAAWSENPPTRVRHFITNIRIVSAVRMTPETQGADNPELVDVKSNVLITRTRGESTAVDIISAERHDTLRSAAGKFKLLKREVFVDHTTIPTNNFAFFF